MSYTFWCVEWDYKDEESYNEFFNTYEEAKALYDQLVEDGWMANYFNPKLSSVQGEKVTVVL